MGIRTAIAKFFAKQKPPGFIAPLQIVAHWEGHAWSARCVDWDLAAQGPDLPTALSRLGLTINAEVARPFPGIDGTDAA